MKVNILGTDYDFTETTGTDDSRLKNADGWCGSYEKSIVVEKEIFNHEQGGNIDLAKSERGKFIRRHELVHGFFNESGLDSYSENEQLVTWIARQFPKMLKAFQDVDAL